MLKPFDLQECFGCSLSATDFQVESLKDLLLNNPLPHKTARIVLGLCRATAHLSRVHSIIYFCMVYMVYMALACCCATLNVDVQPEQPINIKEPTDFIRDCHCDAQPELSR